MKKQILTTIGISRNYMTRMWHVGKASKYEEGVDKEWKVKCSTFSDMSKREDSSCYLGEEKAFKLNQLKIYSNT